MAELYPWSLRCFAGSSAGTGDGSSGACQQLDTGVSVPAAPALASVPIAQNWYQRVAAEVLGAVLVRVTAAVVHASASVVCEGAWW